LKDKKDDYDLYLFVGEIGYKPVKKSDLQLRKSINFVDDEEPLEE
jgi:hypothetical protein